jgi:hypothetical protein
MRETNTLGRAVLIVVGRIVSPTKTDGEWKVKPTKVYRQILGGRGALRLPETVYVGPDKIMDPSTIPAKK